MMSKCKYPVCQIPNNFSNISYLIQSNSQFLLKHDNNCNQFANNFTLLVVPSTS